MKKVIPVLIALVLIVIIGAATAGSIVFEKYSYSKEQANLQEYFKVQGDELAIILQDERVEEKAHLVNDTCYFDLDTVHKYFNDTFYVDKNEGLLLYALPTNVDRYELGDGPVSASGEKNLVYRQGETIYLAADLVNKYTNYSYACYDYRVQVYTEWSERRVATVEKATQIRVKGGVKSPVLRELLAEEQVEVLEKMENWSKIKTGDAFIGYVENKFLSEESKVTETPVTDYVEPEYTTKQLDEKVCLGWHSIGGVGGNDTLESMAANTKGMNVIAPTWFSLNDSQGGYESFASASYVKRAHDMGLQVWGVLDDFNYSLTHQDVQVNVFEVLSTTTTRNRLIDAIVEEAVALGLDGINLDFEAQPSKEIYHKYKQDFAQFVREMSVACRLNNLTFSIDNPVPNSNNTYLCRDVQGKVADYVIIMGYDEHLNSHGKASSAASINFVSNGIDDTLKLVPKEKVVNGIPFYGMLSKTKDAEVTYSDLIVKNVQDFLDRVGQTGTWDEEAQQLYAEWSSGGVKYQLWAETKESILVKLNVMRAKEIAGVAVWCLGCETPDVWEAISAYLNS